MLNVPSDKKELIKFARETVEQCRVSVGNRSEYYRLMNTITETGRYDGTKALINMMNNHLDRTAAHLFSPVELKFSVDYENAYPQNQIERAAVAAKLITRQWERSNTDMLFGRGVFDSLKYGATFMKQWCQAEGSKQTPVYYRHLVMPWQFGVYNETINELDRQPALCETTRLTMAELWRRIWFLPDAQKIYAQVAAHARKDIAGVEPLSYHPVLSASQLNTTGIETTNRPGGIVALNAGAQYGMLGPQIAPETILMHELWVQGDDDYITIQLIEPDILIAPLYKRVNLMIQDSGLQPYRIIQPNEVTNWIWGRSELVDLIEPQGLLARWCDDAMRLFGLQVDKLLGFIGETGMTDELYAQFRTNGWHNLGAGAKVEDLTPKIFPEMLPMIKFVIEIINTLSGFPEIMQGKGEPGVRAGVHANTLLKTASPTLRDRALLVERQCATAADLTLCLMEAKDGKNYWTKGETLQDIDKTMFKLTDLPEDWRVSVDSHSSSPIFSDENAQLIFAGQKSGIVPPRYMIRNLPFPNRDALEAEHAEAEKNKAAQMQKLLQEHPEAGEALAKKMLVGGKR